MGEEEFWKAVQRRRAAGEEVDVHTFRAAWESGVPESEVTFEQRTAAKRLNYCYLYSPERMTANGYIELLAKMRAVVSGRISCHDSLTASACGTADYEELERRVLAGIVQPVPPRHLSLMQTLKERGLSPTGRSLEAPVPRAEKIGRDGRPVKPEPHYRKLEKRGRR